MEWTGARYADKPTVELPAWIAAPPERVWELVSDIALMPRMSGELQSATWLDGLSGPALGARFEGRNKHEALGEWTTTSQIVACERPRAFAWAVGDPENPSATWHFALEPKDGGTLLRQGVQLGPGPSGLSYAVERAPEKEQKIVFVRLREFEAGIRTTLASLKELAEHEGDGGDGGDGGHRRGGGGGPEAAGGSDGTSTGAPGSTGEAGA